MDGSDDVYVLTPSRWNPHSDAYAQTEASQLDWEGNMIPAQYQSKLLLSDIDEDREMEDLALSSIEVQHP